MRLSRQSTPSQHVHFNAALEGLTRPQPRCPPVIQVTRCNDQTGSVTDLHVLAV